MGRITALVLGVMSIGVLALDGIAGSSQQPEPNPLAVTSQPHDREYTYFDVPMEDKEQELVEDFCLYYHFPSKEVVYSLIDVASGYNRQADDGIGDVGYMMVNTANLDWLSEAAGIEDLKTCHDNLKAGIYILSDYWNTYQNMEKALMCYSLGEAGARYEWQQGRHSTEFTKEVLQKANEIEPRKGDTN